MRPHAAAARGVAAYPQEGKGIARFPATRSATVKERFISLRKFTDKFAEVVLVADGPVLVTRGKVPLGFYLPIKVWGEQHDSEICRHMVEMVLRQSGQTPEDISECVDSFIEGKQILYAMRGRFDPPA